MTLREWAIYLAGCGFRVFPIPPGKTVPKVRFSIESTTDTEKVKKIWRSDNSRKNIGIHTGEGLAVVDLDLQADGINSWRDILYEHNEGYGIETMAVSTPSGGMHLYFETTEDIRNSASKLAPGVDIRGFNGFVVAPGSMREATDKKPAGNYEFMNDLAPARMPGWLEKLCLTEADNRATGGVSSDEPLEDVPLGARNDRLFKEACGLRGKGWSHDAILQAIVARNNTFTEPLEQSEVELIASQSAKYAPNAPSLHDAIYTTPKKDKRVSSDEKPEREIRPFDTKRSDELYGMDIPPLNYCVEPLLAEGMYLLNGRPKGGKSWLAMEIAASVATGTKLWDEYQAVQGDVLYLALEDGWRRLKHRLGFFDNPKGIDFVIGDVERIDEGLMQQLQWWYDLQGNPKLVVIDILQRIMGDNKNNEGVYKFDYNMAKRIQDWAIAQHICVFVVHHTRKMITDHDMDSVSGSQGLAGAADGVWFLKSPNNGKTGSLTMFSRDTDSGHYDLTRADKPSGRWEFVGEHDEQDEGPTDVRIIAQIQVDGASTVAELAKALGSGRSHIQQTLTRLFDEGAIEREKEGQAYRYKLSVPDIPGVPK